MLHKYLGLKRHNVGKQVWSLEFGVWSCLGPSPELVTISTNADGFLSYFLINESLLLCVKASLYNKLKSFY